MLVILALALLLLAAAVVLLFAMMGELHARVGAAPEAAGTVSELTQFRVGVTPEVWPEALAGPAGPAGRPRSVLLVLSTICASCAKVADQIAAGELGGREHVVGIVVSCANGADGEDFVDRYGLRGITHFVDAGGAWTSGSFGVAQSPAALVFDRGVLTEAYSFSTVTAVLDRAGLRAAVTDAV